MAIAAPQAPTPVRFDSFQFDTGDAQAQEVLTARLLGRGETDDIVVLGQHEDGWRSLDVYTLRGQRWQRVHGMDVDDDVIFADTMELGGQERLLLYRRGHIEWLDPRDWSPKPLLDAAAIYKAPARGLPHFDIGRDIDGDGLEDIAVPDFDGYWLWLQRDDGSFGPRNKLLAAATALLNFGAVTYRPRSLYALDYDGDAVTDLAVWGEPSTAAAGMEAPRLLIYVGVGDGAFDPNPLDAVLPIDVDSDDMSVSFGFGQESTTRTLYDFKDYNGDGVADVVTTTVEIAGLFDHATRYEVHFGRRQGNVTTFSATPDTAIASDNLQAPFDSRDFNGDGKLDFGMGSIDVGIGTLLRALLTGTVRFDLDFYLLGDAGYPATPNVTRPIKIRFSLTSGDVLSGNWVEIGDADGDGVSDLYARHDEARIDIYRGTAAGELFADEPVPIAVSLPDYQFSPDNVDVDDLNGDGRDDLVILFPAREDQDEPNRLGVVLSR